MSTDTPRAEHSASNADPAHAGPAGTGEASPAAEGPTEATHQTADRIRAAAALLFVERPYADVTIDQVAAAAEVTKGAVYHHFSSKEQLYLVTLLLDLEQKRRTHESAAQRPGTCFERLRALTGAFFALPRTERRLAQLVRRDGNVFGEPNRTLLVDAYHAAVTLPIERILRDGVRDGEIVPLDPRLLAWQFVALVEVLLSDYAEQRFISAEDRLNVALSVFFRGCAWSQRGGPE